MILVCFSCSMFICRYSAGGQAIDKFLHLWGVFHSVFHGVIRVCMDTKETKKLTNGPQIRNGGFQR